MSEDRRRFLERVRAATGRDARAPAPVPPTARALPDAPDAPVLAERFKVELERVHGHVTLVSTELEARDAVREALRGAASAVRSPHAVLDEVGVDAVFDELGVARAAPRDAAAAVTGCEFAVAATGSVALSSAWGRLTALLPFRHVIVLRASQLVPDVPDAYARLESDAPLPAAWGFHTGPSKSADIEQVMALGVHGPGDVRAIVIVDESRARP